MTLVVSLFFTVVVTLLFILALRPVALAVGLVDTPGGRKKHKDSTPVVGGIAMYLGLIFGSMLLEDTTTFNSLIMGGSLLIVVGTIDDRFELAPTIRLIAQTCAVLIMILASDIQLKNIGAPLFFLWELGGFSTLFTILVTLTVINAFNTIDGIDGLSGGVAFIALIFMALVSINSSALALILLLTATIVGFLICNFPIHSNRHVKCFMGDAGSTFIGFSVAYLGILLSQGESATMSPVTGLWLVAIPIYDVVTAVLRRIIRKQSPFRPDRDHLHHILMDAGLSSRMTLLLILLITCVTATIGLLGEVFAIHDGVMFLLWLALGVSCYGHTVFNKGKKIISLISTFRSKLVVFRLM